MSNILEVVNLKTSFYTDAGEVRAVDGVGFKVKKGEVTGIVGESGCGKSVTALSIMNLLSVPGKIKGGSIIFDGKELVGMPEKKMQKLRGNEISMIFQDHTTSLNPVYTVGNQIIESLVFHQKLSRWEAKEKAIKLLGKVGIPSPDKRINQYPYEFSGGMRQRVMIAMALCCRPKLLIADEPTTALDVTVQAQIIELMKDLRERINTSIILISHDLGVIAEICSRVIVMYAGIIVEQGLIRDIFYSPQHPYTRGLLKSVQDISAGRKERLATIEGQPPDLLQLPAGCPFYPRCDHVMQVCVNMRPPLFKQGSEHMAACWLLHPDAPKVTRNSCYE